MWPQFNAEARVALFYAQEEATQAEVQPEHLFLGLVRDESMFSYRLLHEFHCPVGAMQEALHSQLPKRTVQEIGTRHLSQEAKLAIDFAYDEFYSLNHPYIGSEHLLLGLILLDYPLLQEMFRSCDISPEALREKITFYARHQNLSIRERFAVFRQFLSQKRR